MQMDLTIVIQKMKIKELDARASTLRARSDMENFKLTRMEKDLEGIKNEKS